MDFEQIVGGLQSTQNICRDGWIPVQIELGWGWDFFIFPRKQLRKNQNMQLFICRDGWIESIAVPIFTNCIISWDEGLIYGWIPVQIELGWCWEIIVGKTEAVQQ